MKNHTIFDRIGDVLTYTEVEEAPVRKGGRLLVFRTETGDQVTLLFSRTGTDKLLQVLKAGPIGVKP